MKQGVEESNKAEPESESPLWSWISSDVRPQDSLAFAKLWQFSNKSTTWSYVIEMELPHGKNAAQSGKHCKESVVAPIDQVAISWAVYILMQEPLETCMKFLMWIWKILCWTTVGKDTNGPWDNHGGR